LNKSNLCIFQNSFNRPNLVFSVIEKEQYSVVETMFVRILTGNYLTESGIIYCFSKKDCEEVAFELNKLFASHAKKEISKNKNSNLARVENFAAFYHAGMETDEKNKIQAMWMNNKVMVIVATIAFGMGINNASVRYVYHHTIPRSIEGYYQEAGRAGRDGKKSDCVVYYSYTDVYKIRSMLSDQTKTNEDRQRRGFGPVTQQTIDMNLKLFTKMVDYCKDDRTCRRKMQLSYFNEKFDKAQCKNTCDNCLRMSEYGTGELDQQARQKSIMSYYANKNKK